MPERRREKYDEGDHVSSVVIRGLGKGFVDFFLILWHMLVYIRVSITPKLICVVGMCQVTEIS